MHQAHPGPGRSFEYSYTPKPDEDRRQQQDDEERTTEDRDGYDDDDYNSRKKSKKPTKQTGRKRKSSTNHAGVEDSEGHASEDDVNPDHSLNDSDAAHGSVDAASKKRVKTPRACDSCRRKKIRYLATSDLPV